MIMRKASTRGQMVKKMVLLALRRNRAIGKLILYPI